MSDNMTIWVPSKRPKGVLRSTSLRKFRIWNLHATREPYRLELAARGCWRLPTGTGVVTRAMASRLPADARIVGDRSQSTDARPCKGQASPDNRIVWQQADALALPFVDQGFDVVACQFGAMFFPDKVQGYREARRMLKPGGCFLFNVWDRISENEFADTVTQALATIFPHDPPQFLERTPHGYHDVDQIRAELIAAGFSTISVDAVDHRSKASSPRHPAVAYCQGTPLRNEIEARDKSRLKEGPITRPSDSASVRRWRCRRPIRAFVITATR